MSTCSASPITAENGDISVLCNGHSSVAGGSSSPDERSRIVTSGGMTPTLKRPWNTLDTQAEVERRAIPDDDPGRLKKMEAACATLLECLGEDISREGLTKTPRRMAEALLACTKGYSQDLSTVVNGAIFEEDHHEMILVKDIDLHSLCEHHMVPFTGKVHIAYIPRSKVR